MNNKGFTLIEMLIVMGLAAAISSLGLFMSMSSYNTSSFRNERNTLVSALMRARSQAVNNVCVSTPSLPCTDGKAHGVHLDVAGGRVTQYVIFQGVVYDPTDSTNEIIKTEHLINSSGVTDVVFTELSANVAVAMVMNLTGGTGELSDIHINEEGQIYWTN